MAVIEERKGRDGKKTFRVKVRIRGYRPLTSTFSRKRDAEDWAQRQESDIRRSLKFDDHKASTTTLSETIALYKVSMARLKPTQHRDRTCQLNWWEKRLGHLFLINVNPDKILETKRELLKRTWRDKPNATYISPATINQYLISLSAVLTYAEKELHWLQHNPMRHIKKEKLPNNRVRYLTEKERLALLEACKESPTRLLHPLVMLALCTGMRKNEILHLTWKDVDFKKRIVRAMQTKNGEPRSVPLTGPAETVLKQLDKVRRLDTDLIFARPKNTKPLDIQNHWEDALKKAKIKDFRFHDLRHTAATYLLESGATLPELSAILGHRSIQMVKRYAHLADNHAVQVAEKMTKRVFG